jgi:predicted tellurium resistance membrane protein TerC
MPLIYIGVFIGILAMRFVAQSFVRLMERFPFLETIAFIVIAILGLKLLSSIFSHYNPDSAFGRYLDGEELDLIISFLTVAIFVIPILTSYFFNFPKKVKGDSEMAHSAEGVLENQDDLMFGEDEDERQNS